MWNEGGGTRNVFGRTSILHHSLKIQTILNWIFPALEFLGRVWSEPSAYFSGHKELNKPTTAVGWVGTWLETLEKYNSHSSRNDYYTTECTLQK